MDTNQYTVSDAARLASTTVRTLHHYDEIGLLKPIARSRAGYRLYTESDLRRLHQILLFRELGFTLEAIRQLLDDAAFDRRTALQTQRVLLAEDVVRKQAVLRAIDVALHQLDTTGDMTMSELFDGFDQFEHAPYEEEARERWGNTDAYKESQRRVKGYRKADWGALKDEAETIVKEWAALMKQGVSADDPRARSIAERHRLHIDRWFYPCPHRMHTGLADLYTGDPRFTAYYDRHVEGLAEFVSASIHANAAAQSRL
jgi:DNA-binding transcriptional MerR regulator